MKFSVIIPVYNAEKYLVECMESVLGQTYDDFEVILVDDGSTDGSPAICDGCAERYPGKVKVIHQENRGQLASRISAANAASGDYCVYADADDLLVPDALERLNEKLASLGAPDMLVYSFFYEENNERRPAAKLFEDEKTFKGDNLNEFRSLFFTGTGLNNVWTKAVKRDILTGIDIDLSGFYSLRCAEDRLYSMIIADRCASAAYAYLPLYVYRLFDGSVTRRYRVGNIEKFNVSATYPAEDLFLEKWDLPIPEYKYRLEAQRAGSLFHTLWSFYDNVPRNERKAVIGYDWRSFIPGLNAESMAKNPYVNQTTKTLWTYVENGDRRALGAYYRKKRLKKKLKKLLGKG